MLSVATNRATPSCLNATSFTLVFRHEKAYDEYVYTFKGLNLRLTKGHSGFGTNLGPYGQHLKYFILTTQCFYVVLMA